MRLHLPAACALALLSSTTAARAQQAAPAPPPAVPGVMRLHIESPAPAELIERLGVFETHYGAVAVRTTETTRKICVSPCDQMVDARAGHMFELTSPAFPDPEHFRLAGLHGDVTLTVKPGSTERHNGGVLLTVLGGLSFLIGAITMPLSLSKTIDPGPALRPASVVLFVGGGGLLAGGLALLFTSDTKLKLEQRPPTAARAPRYWMGEL